MNKPKITIITASYNSRDYIEGALKSIAIQTYKNIEHLVIDAASTDDTIEIVKKYSTTKWMSESDQGIYDALNKGFTQADGDIFSWLDSDNYYASSSVLERVANTFIEKPATQVVITNSYLLYPEHNNEKELIDNGIPTYEKLLNKGNQFIPESVFFKRELFEKVGGFNLSYRLLADYDLWIRIFKLNPKVVKLSVVSAIYIVRNDALLRNDPFNAWLESFMIGKCHGRSKGSRLRNRIRYIWERIKFPLMKFLRTRPRLHAFYTYNFRKFFKPLY